MSTENRMLHVMRAMAWQRAKGEMASMLETYYRDLDDDKFARFQEAVTAFEKHVEDEGLQE